MNEVANFANALPMNPEDLEKGLQNVANSIQTGNTMTLLRLDKEGYFVYGQENIEVEQGSRWAINPASLHHGWANWVDSELIGEVMVPATQPFPPKSSLPQIDADDNWRQQVAMQLRCMSGEDEGTVVLYKGTSLGLRNAVKELIGELIAQLRTDKDNCVPVVELEADNYRHKKHGKVYIPVLNIVDWISFKGMPVDTAETDTGSDEEAEAPRSSRGRDTARAKEPEPERAPRGRRAPAAEPEPAEQPTSRRRRR